MSHHTADTKQRFSKQSAATVTTVTAKAIQTLQVPRFKTVLLDPFFPPSLSFFQNERKSAKVVPAPPIPCERGQNRLKHVGGEQENFVLLTRFHCDLIG